MNKFHKKGQKVAQANVITATVRAKVRAWGRSDPLRARAGSDPHTTPSLLPLRGDGNPPTSHTPPSCTSMENLVDISEPQVPSKEQRDQ